MSDYNDARRKAFERGSAAFLAGKSVETNPHKVGAMWIAWRNGWLLAAGKNEDTYQEWRNRHASAQ